MTDEPEWADGPDTITSEERPAESTEAPARVERTSGPIGRGGLFPLPKRPEKTLLGTLSYPLWDGSGVACLLVWPIPLTVLSLIVLGVLPMALWGEDRSMLALAPITLGFVVVFVLALGYIGAMLGSILVESSRGEVHHPRWPEVDIVSLLGTVIRWCVALGLGAAVAAWPALEFLRSRDPTNWTNRLIAAELFSLGGVVGLVALLAIYLHEDVFAIDPRVIVPAILRIGLKLMAPAVLLSVAVGLGVMVVAAVYRAADYGFAPLLGMTWVAWVYGLYAAMVVARATGRAYHRRAKAVGWFATKRRRVEEPPPPAPPPVD